MVMEPTCKCGYYVLKSRRLGREFLSKAKRTKSEKVLREVKALDLDVLDGQ